MRGVVAPDFIDSMLMAIIGIEIEITRLAEKSKLSQNKDARDIRSAGEALKVQGDSAIAEAMLGCAPAKSL